MMVFIFSGAESVRLMLRRSKTCGSTSDEAIGLFIYLFRYLFEASFKRELVLRSITTAVDVAAFTAARSFRVGK